MDTTIIEKMQEFEKALNEMRMDNYELYLQYSLMNGISKILDERKKEFSELIIEEMGNNKEEKKKFEFGSFTVANRKSYEYSEKVDILKEKVKDQQKLEEKEGIAKPKETKYLVVGKATLESIS